MKNDGNPPDEGTKHQHDTTKESANKLYSKVLESTMVITNGLEFEGESDTETNNTQLDLLQGT